MLTPEQITEIGLTEEQSGKLMPLLNNTLAEKQKEFAKSANDNAEKILEGAVKEVAKLTGRQRANGEHAAAYIESAANDFLKSKQSEVDSAKLKYDDLIKAGAGDAQIKAQLEEVNKKYQELQKKEALFAEYEKEDYKSKWQQASEQLTGFKLSKAFSDVKPAKPEGLNDYEYKGRWAEFERNVKAKYNIEYDETGVALAIDKENQFKITPLTDLVKADKDISEMLKGRQQTGSGSKPAKGVTIEGVPFEVPENATPEQRVIAIRTYLASKGIDKLSDQYAKEFAELNAKIKAKQA